MVTSHLRADADTRLGGEADGTPSLVVEVFGADGDVAAVTLGEHTRFRGRLVAPAGSVRFGAHSVIHGSIAARRVSLGGHSTAKPAGVSCGVGSATACPRGELCLPDTPGGTNGHCACTESQCGDKVCFAGANGPECDPVSTGPCPFGFDACGNTVVVGTTGGPPVLGGTCAGTPTPPTPPACGSTTCDPQTGDVTYHPGCESGCHTGLCSFANGGEGAPVVSCLGFGNVAPGKPCTTIQSHPGACDTGKCISSINVSTQAMDNARTGAQTHETVLTPALVGATNASGEHFGELGMFDVGTTALANGQAVNVTINAQPLYLEDVLVGAPAKAHDVVLVATSTNDVILYDATKPDAIPAGYGPKKTALPTTPLWKIKLGEAPLPTPQPGIYDECDFLAVKNENNVITRVPLSCDNPPPVKTADYTHVDPQTGQTVDNVCDKVPCITRAQDAYACCCSPDPLHTPECYPTAACGQMTTNQDTVGIMSTPVADPAAGVVYVVTRTGAWPAPYGVRPDPKNPKPGDYPTVAFTLQQVRLRDGAVLKSKVIDGACPGCTNALATDKFEAPSLYQRPGLLLAPLNGDAGGKKVIYVAFGGTSCDRWEIHGWLMAFDAVTLAPLGVLDTTPGYGHKPPRGGPLGAFDGAGIWQSGRGLVGDAEGNVTFNTGNGPDSSRQGGKSNKTATENVCDHNYPGEDILPPDFPWDQQLGNSVVKVKLTPGQGFEVVNKYLPPNSLALRCRDVTWRRAG